MTIFENTHYTVTALIPPRILDKGLGTEMALNYEVKNKATGAVEHTCANQPQAITVARQLNDMLEVVLSDDEVEAVIEADQPPASVEPEIH